MAVGRAIVIGIICMMAASVLGVIVWFALGKSYDNYSAAVIIPCNLIPLAGLLGGGILGWKSANE